MLLAHYFRIILLSTLYISVISEVEVINNLQDKEDQTKNIIPGMHKEI